MSERGATQDCQHGALWWGQSNLGPRIVAISMSGKWGHWPDAWQEGDSDHSCADAERNEFGPIRGFGRAWCDQGLGAENRLGNPTAPEQTIDKFRIEVRDDGGIVFYINGMQSRILLPGDRWGMAPPPSERKLNRARIGVHGPNIHNWRDLPGGDVLYRGLDTMGAEALLLMSFTVDEVLQKIRETRPNIAITCRLYTDGFGAGNKHPSPSVFVDRLTGDVQRFLSWGVKRFIVHNEPNHLHGVEGWGDGDDQAVDFAGWFLETVALFRHRFGDSVSLGFPGLAVPHRDQEWIDICLSEGAIPAADWVSIHSYWQSPNINAVLKQDRDQNHLDGFWGLRFRGHLIKMSEAGCLKPVEITEYGNSNVQNGYPVNWDRFGQEYVEWHQRIFTHPTIEATHGFILASHDDQWEGFRWISSAGQIRDVVYQLAAMERPPLYVDEGEPPPPPPEPTPEPEPGPTPEPREERLIILPTSGKMFNLGYVIHALPLPGGGLEVLEARPIRIIITEDGRTITGTDETRLVLRGIDEEEFKAEWQKARG